MRTPVEATIAIDWQTQGDGNQVYLIEKLPPAKVAAAIEKLMIHVPDGTQP